MSLGKIVLEHLIAEEYPIGRMLNKIDAREKPAWLQSKQFSKTLRFFALFPQRDLYCRMCKKHPKRFVRVRGIDGDYLALVGKENLLFTVDHVVPHHKTRMVRRHGLHGFEN